MILYSCRGAADNPIRHALAHWARLCRALHLGRCLDSVLPRGDVYYAVEGEEGVAVMHIIHCMITVDIEVVVQEFILRSYRVNDYHILPYNTTTTITTTTTSEIHLCLLNPPNQSDRPHLKSLARFPRAWVGDLHCPDW